MLSNVLCTYSTVLSFSFCNQNVCKEISLILLLKFSNTIPTSSKSLVKNIIKNADCVEQSSKEWRKDHWKEETHCENTSFKLFN